MGRSGGFVLAILLAAVLGACSGDDSGGAGDGNDEAALETAVVSYSEAYLGDDASTAYGLLSQRCGDRLDEREYGATVAAAGAYYEGVEMTDLTVDGIDGDRASVTYRYSDSEIDQIRQPWVLEEGAWRYDDC